MIRLGEYNKLTVVRKSDLGYMLTDGKDEILMHFKQTTRELNDNEEVSVFVYADKEKRLTGSMIEPYVTINTAGFVKVVNVIPGVGVFVDINTPKDILISKDYLPFKEEGWPQLDDLLFIRLKSKQDIVVGKPLNRFEIKELKSEARYADYEVVSGYVCRIAEKGIGIITNDKVYVFVPYTQLRGSYRMGQTVDVTITKSIDGECYGTLNAHKEELMDTDKETILEYLNKHHGIMKLTAKSSAEDIAKLFNMSRKAFKRALGNLYKERLVEFDEEKTYLVSFKKSV